MNIREYIKCLQAYAENYGDEVEVVTRDSSRFGFEYVAAQKPKLVTPKTTPKVRIY